MNVVELTNVIQLNTDYIAEILEALGHTDVRDRQNYFQCSNLDGDNSSAISILKDGLLYQNFTRNRKGNIYTIVMDEKGCDFPTALSFVAKVVGYKDKKILIKPPFGGFYKSIMRSQTNPELEMPTYSESILPPKGALSKMWFDDGVDYLTQERHGIRIDFDSNRILIPEYTITGELCGCKARYNGNCPLDERWSMYIPFSKSLTIYGFHYHYNDILKKQKCFVFESEKACSQLESMGCNLGLGIGGHDISTTQQKYIRSLGVTTILGFDQGISEEEIIYQAKKLIVDNQYWKNKIGYIVMDDMPEKCSPTDCGRKCFQELCSKQVKWVN